MGACQSNRNSAVDAKRNRMDAANKKMDEGQFLYNDTANTKTDNKNNTNQDGGSASVAGNTTTSTGTTSRHDKVLEWKDTLRNDGDLAAAVVHIETSLTRRVEDVYEGVYDGPILGSGAAGVVRKCKHKETGMEFAVKCLNVGIIESDATIETLREEIFIMCQADHPDILRLEEVYESDTQIYLVEDLLSGGDMFDRLEEQPNYHYSEIQCAKIVKQMLSSIRYLHANKVVHRDLKLENFLFDDKESDNIRLIDFGLSKHFNHDGYKHNDSVGTPYTIAPEMIKGEYDEKVDVWALGVITYLLLCGDPPFGGMDGEALMTIKNNILACKLVFEPKEVWDQVSDTAKGFIRKLLTEDPNKRPSALEAQKHEWMIVNADLDPESSKPLNTKVINNILKFKDYSTLHKVLLEVVSFTLNCSQIKEMKKEFAKIDRDGRGEITLDDLKEVMLNRICDVTGSPSSMTEEEVESIFNSLQHLSNSDATIRWHDFIAAGLSRAEIDIRNLRLVFNRFDHDGKGYIAFEDLSDFLRQGDGTMNQECQDMWNEGLAECKAKDNQKMYFEDFQRMMKGRARQRSSVVSFRASFSLSSSPSDRKLLVSEQCNSSRLLTEVLSMSDKVADTSRTSIGSSTRGSCDTRHSEGSIRNSLRGSCRTRRSGGSATFLMSRLSSRGISSAHMKAVAEA